MRGANRGSDCGSSRGSVCSAVVSQRVKSGEQGSGRRQQEAAPKDRGGLKTVGPYAFSYCTRLKGIEFPDTVEVIEDGCFSWSGLETFTVPERVCALKIETFEHCSALRLVRASSHLAAADNFHSFFTHFKLEVLHERSQRSQVVDPESACKPDAKV